MNKEKTIKLNSPAKINLFLDVLNKRQDGYHDIKTVFERINLFDEIELALTPDGVIKIFCSHPDVPLDSSNLCYKAAQLLQQDFMIADGVEITIKKNIPVASGLGGGSSNAATVLMGLNQLWKLGLNKERLLHYAAKVGSDVSFFIWDKSFALGSGRGDKLENLPKVEKELWHILVIADEKMFAKDAYDKINLDLTKQGQDINILTLALQAGDLKKIRENLFNKLEITVEKSCKTISKVKRELEALGVKNPLVSGSGPAVYGLVDTRKEAENFKIQLDKKGLLHSFVVCTF